MGKRQSHDFNLQGTHPARPIEADFPEGNTSYFGTFLTK